MRKRTAKSVFRHSGFLLVSAIDALRVRSGTLVRQAAGYVIIVRIFEQAIEILQNLRTLSGNPERKPAKVLARAHRQED
jgi:hypothetical protein